MDESAWMKAMMKAIVATPPTGDWVVLNIEPTIASTIDINGDKVASIPIKQAQEHVMSNDQTRVTFNFSPMALARLEDLAKIEGTKAEVLRKALIIYDQAITLRNNGEHYVCLRLVDMQVVEAIMPIAN